MATDDRKKQIAKTCFQKATEAMSKENWDYAIDQLTISVKMEPENLFYRQSLRGVEFKKFKNNGTGASMAGMRLMGIRSEVKKARSAKKWDEMDQAAEKGLVVNPWDAQLNADVGEASMELGNFDIALFGYQAASKAEPKNKDYLRGLAAALEAKNDFVGASKIWQKIYDLDPLDGQARSNIQACLSKATIHRGGFEEAKSTQEVRDNVQGYEQSVKGNVQQHSVGPGESPEEDLKRAIRKAPENKDNYQKLGELLRREGRLEEALEAFNKGFELSNKDANIGEVAEDVQIDILKKNLETARARAAKKADDPAVKEAVATQAKELLEQEIDVFTRRAERYPNDMKLRFELAQRLWKSAKFNLAAKYLQQASKDIRIEGPALLLLGKCFLQEKQNGLAQRQFEKAVEKFNVADQPEEFAECHYFLGRLAENAKDMDKAVRHFTEVLGVDYDYKDARARMEKIESERGNNAEGAIDV